MDVGQDRRRSPASRQGARLESGHWPARTRRLLEESCNLCVAGLREPLLRCLREFEQQLFAMAERAHRPVDQQDCIASRQLMQQSRTVFEQRFMERVVETFNGLGAERQPVASIPEAKPWQSLELLDTAQQELSMTLEQTGARGDTRHSAVLHELGYRLAVLIAAPPLDGQALPLGLHSLARACLQTSSELELPQQHERREIGRASCRERV